MSRGPLNRKLVLHQGRSLARQSIILQGNTWKLVPPVPLDNLPIQEVRIELQNHDVYKYMYDKNWINKELFRRKVD